jgi:hypothetical protein
MNGTHAVFQRTVGVTNIELARASDSLVVLCHVVWVLCEVKTERLAEDSPDASLFVVRNAWREHSAVFSGILRLDEQKTIKMDFLNKLKFWKKRINVSKKVQKY